ncbi:UvrD-helicase domain-containing protein [Arthrobacter sp. ISL-95]|uniref:UvrD-helicase domain-containing protein n=1 Tax=Arthrobacter sp. ISL-95 TaxID=2819116 RepID=UPI001BE66468|nr:UvrD-helicase domain-containing protein [Arthrobacter sp. ISL-95]MBT2585382.1 AAA family ATPase [Arthrobacter sp. ISL-95]
MTDGHPLSTSADRILGALPGSITLPAGAGKTELVAAVVSAVAAGGGHVLVLTHTHAGVDALRRRMAKFSVPKGQVSVRTIDAWSFDLIQHYPMLAGLAVAADPDWALSQEYHRAAARAVSSEPVQRMLRVSYDVIVVDEYQDCLIDQHHLVVAISATLPTLVLGDPLQGLFNFGGQQPVKWHRDVLNHFPEVKLEAYPWRWHAHNPELGHWLLSIRDPLSRGNAINLSGSPVKWLEMPSDQRFKTKEQARACFRSPQAGTTVALGRFRHDIIRPALLLNGSYSVMEALDSQVTEKFCHLIDNGSAQEIAAGAIEFAVSCATGVAAHLDTSKRRQLAAGKSILTRTAERQVAYSAINQMLAQPSPTSVLAALDAVLALPDINVYCREAWTEATNALKFAGLDATLTTSQALTQVRNGVRARGRRPARRVLSRPLLVKGLEYDHAILLDADQYTAQELYVALTRGAKSITVVSKSPVLSPATP